MYKNKYFTKNDEIDVTEMLNAVPAKMTIDEKTDWLEAFDCLDEETQDELVGVRNIMSERSRIPDADETEEEIELADETEDDAEAYFMNKANEFDRKKSAKR